MSDRILKSTFIVKLEYLLVETALDIEAIIFIDPAL